MVRKIVVTSGKGGVGKTTVVANLGRMLAGFGKRVLLVDIDFGLNNLDVTLGLENKITYDLTDVYEGRCRAKQALIQCDNCKNLYVLPSVNTDVFSSMSGQNIKLIVDSVSSLFDYVIFDCPAGIDVGFHRATSCAEEAIVVVTPNIPSLRDADKVLSVLNSYQLKSISLVVNRARGDLIINDKMMLPSDIGTLLKTKLLGVLPEEDTVFLSNGYKLPTRSDSFRAYKIFASNVNNGGDKLFDVTGKYSGFFGSIRRRLKKSV